MRSIFSLLFYFFNRKLLLKPFFFVFGVYFGRVLLVVVQKSIQLPFRRLLHQILNVHLANPVHHARRKRIQSLQNVLQRPTEHLQLVRQPIILRNLLIILTNLHLVALIYLNFIPQSSSPSPCSRKSCSNSEPKTPLWPEERPGSASCSSCTPLGKPHVRELLSEACFIAKTHQQAQLQNKLNTHDSH